MANLYRKIGDMTYDGLITDLVPENEVRAGEIASLDAEATLVRGTLLSKSTSDGKLVVAGTDATLAEQKFNGDGSTKTFTVSAKPAALVSVKIGSTATTDYTYNASTGVVTFTTAPVSGTNNVIVSYASDSYEPYCVLCDDVVVGTAESVVVPVYTAGCFDPDKITLAEGYSLTSADIDTLRKYNIEFKAAQK